MYPWLLYHPPISTYGACIVAGLIIAWLLARTTARRESLDPSRIDLLVPWLTAAGIPGAFLFGAVANVAAATAQHGTVLLGSLLLATAAGAAYAVVSRIPLGILGDICAAPVALGIACGRVGCFCAGCCYGLPCSDGVAITFPQASFAWNAQVASGLLSPDAAASLAVHPVQLYEAALCLLLAIALTIRLRPRLISGERFLFLGIGYSLIRFPLEYLRADNASVALGLTFSQILAVIVLIICLVTLFLRRRFADTFRLRIVDMNAVPRPAP